jgi:glycine/D-amino acid oxidase-like deaminating enzyme
LGRELVKSLDEAQFKTAFVETVAPKEMITAAEKRVNPLKPDGLSDTELKPEQKAKLHEIIREYTDRLRPEIAAETWADIEKNGLGNTSHLILNTAEGQIDTGLMMKNLLGLAQSLGVFSLNGFEVDRIEDTVSGYIIVGDGGKVSFPASKVIIANNAFASRLYPDVDIKPARAQVLITQPVEGLKLKGAFHADKGYYYFRNVGNRILFGGGRNLDFDSEETFSDGLTTIVQTRLDEMLKSIIAPYTNVVVDQRWSGFMAMGTKKSYIVERRQPGLVMAVRCGGMGVAIGSLTGKQAAQLILKEL